MLEEDFKKILKSVKNEIIVAQVLVVSDANEAA